MEVRARYWRGKSHRAASGQTIRATASIQMVSCPRSSRPRPPWSVAVQLASFVLSTQIALSIGSCIYCASIYVCLSLYLCVCVCVERSVNAFTGAAFLDGFPCVNKAKAIPFQGLGFRFRFRVRFTLKPVL